MNQRDDSEILTQDVRRDTEAAINTVIPVLKEEVTIGKEVRQTGTLRVTKTVHEAEEIVRANLLSEKAQVTRVPKDEVVQAAPPIRNEGDEVVVSIVKEVLVVTKQLRLVEELRISKSQVTTPFEESVSLLSEEVVIERT